MNGTNGTIFVVDDNPTNRQILQAVLTRVGYKVKLLETGKEALDYTREQIPDLMLLDIMMPEIDGFEVCMRLKRRPSFKDVPILFISALDDHATRVRGLKIGAVDYISKPFNKDELLARVHTHMSIRQLTSLLQDKIEENESLVRAMSHDLSNLLQVNLSVLELMLAQRDDDHKDMRYLKMMLDMSHKQRELIDNIRDLISVESGKREVELSAVCLHETVQNAYDIFEHKLASKNLKLQTMPDPLPPQLCVLAEPISFQNSVINNLLSNAIKFSFEGDSIQMHVHVENDVVRIVVCDHGMGIQAERLPDIFNPSKSTSTTGTQGERGTGFGMPLVKRFVEKYGGMVSIESRHMDEWPDDHGTTVTIHLPAAGNIETLATNATH